MGDKFRHAILLFGTLSANITEWQNTLSHEEAQAKVGNALRNLPDQNFEMICDLIALLQTEPGKRLFGDLDFTTVEEALDRIRLARTRTN